MSKFPFSTIIQAPCVVPPTTGTREANCPEGQPVPGTDERCSDLAFRKAHPELCKDFPVLKIKPAVFSLCQLQSRKMRVFLYANSVETEITTGLVWECSNQSVAVIGALSGKVTGLSEGIATVGVSWQDLTAQAQVTVLPADCCSDSKVGMVLAVDNSLSMTSAFSATYATKLSYAKAAAYKFAGELNVTKDVMAVLTFSDAGAPVTGLTNEVAALKNAITAIPSTTKGTNIADALEDAIDLLDLDATLTRKVVVLFTDLENHDGPDPVAIADEFEEGGGIVIVVGVRSFGNGFDLGNQIATGGFFLNAHNATAKKTQDLLSGLKGYFCAGNCALPGDEYVNIAKLNYAEFMNWDVVPHPGASAGSNVDLIGGTPPYDLFDLLPGNGLYVDMCGSSYVFPGRLLSKVTYDFVAGTTYRLACRVAGNQRAPNSGDYTLKVSVGAFTTNITISDWKQDFMDYFLEFTPVGNFSAKLDFEMVAINEEFISFGLLLDDIVLVRDPAGTPVFMLQDDFDTENSVYIEPPCGPGTVVLEGGGYGYGYDCYGTGCLDTPPEAQVEDPFPNPDVLETAGQQLSPPVESQQGFNPAGIFPTKTYLDLQLASFLAQAKAYADALAAEGAQAAEGFVEKAGDTMQGNLVMEGAYIGFAAEANDPVDLKVKRDSAHSLAIEDAANANDLRIYKTKTSDSIFERLFVGWSAGTALIRTQFLGVGMAFRDLELNGILTIEETKAVLSGGLNFVGTDHAGLHLNRLTTVQRDALTPVVGMLIYNTTDAVAQVYQNGAWVDWGGAVVTAMFSGAANDPNGVVTAIKPALYYSETDGSLWRKTGVGLTDTDWLPTFQP